MKNRWPSESNLSNDPLQQRIASSRLLGEEPALVLHGGGNTSVKVETTNLFGEPETLLYIKGSGEDLATITESGFAAIRLETLQKMAALPALSDTDMVRYQRAAMVTPDAPNPSLETILHAIIPFRYVDHTHADAVIALSNTPDPNLLKKVYGSRVLILPYAMPGFQLAKMVYEATQNLCWSDYDAIVLQSHGVLTFGDDAKTAYDRMIQVVSQAEDTLKEHQALLSTEMDFSTSESLPSAEHLLQLATLRHECSKARNEPIILSWDRSNAAKAFSETPNLPHVAAQGPLTPDHVTLTKRTPVVLSESFEDSLKDYATDYQAYFQKYATEGLIPLDPAPRWAVWPGQGVISMGGHVAESQKISDIVRHTYATIQASEKLGGWKGLDPKHLFDMEYWELQQAKLKKHQKTLPLQGQVALVTGAANGIGKACAEALLQQGAVVTALDINPDITQWSDQPQALGICCDLTDPEQVQQAIETTIDHYGGLDFVVSNAGLFPKSMKLESMNANVWDQSLDLNLSSHQRLIQQCTPYLKKGWNPAIVIIASKNVPAPGPGAGAYSVAKAGLTQLARVAAMELAADGIRVNVIHPNAVFDTSIWTPDVLDARAKHYGMSVDDYKQNNLLHTEITSHHVAELALAMLGPAFAKTTGAQVPIDGGNERVI